MCLPLQRYRISGDEVGRLIEDGMLRTTLNERGGRINALDLRQAHAAVEAGRSVGKTVLSGC